MERESLVRDRLGLTVRRARYDYYIVLLTDLGVIRSIRFSGDVKALSADSSFVVEKLERSRGRDSPLGKELLGSFITYGKVRNEELLNMQAMIGSELGLIRPVSELMAGKAAIFPSPLSLMAFTEAEDARIKLLSPATVTVMLNMSKLKPTRLKAFGRISAKYAAPGNLISCKPFHDRLNCTAVGPFQVALYCEEDLCPLQDILGSMRRDYVMAHVAGFFIFPNERPYLMQGRGDGFFLAFEEATFLPEAEVMSMVGEPLEINLGSGGKQKRSIYPSLVADRKTFEIALNELWYALSKISREYQPVNLLETKTLFDESTFRETYLEMFDRGDSKLISCLSPPLITELLEHKDLRADDLKKAIRELSVEFSQTTGDEAFLHPDLRLHEEFSKNPLIKKIYESKRFHTRAWVKIFSNVKQIHKNLGLGYII
ncbi:MAG: hypothetical protein ABWK01_03820 [Infirmifilum sp.]